MTIAPHIRLAVQSPVSRKFCQPGSHVTFDPVRFGAFARRLRLSDGLTVHQVRDRSDELISSTSTIHNLEAGKTANPEVRIFVGLARGLGVTTHYVLERAGFLQGEERVEHFTLEERSVLARALGEHLVKHPPENSRHVRLLAELNASIGARDAADRHDREQEIENGGK